MEEITMIESNRLIEGIQNKWIRAGKKAEYIIQLMKNENLPCTFNEAMEIAIKVEFNEIDFSVFFNNYKITLCR
jgi:hypothetical protein